MQDAPTEKYDVLFSSNTTESINFVAACIHDEVKGDLEPVILITNLEHSSNDLPWRMIGNAQVLRLPVNKEGFWDDAELEKILQDYNGERCFGKKRIILVAVSGASNVLGSCINLQKTGETTHRNGEH